MDKIFKLYSFYSSKVFEIFKYNLNIAFSKYIFPVFAAIPSKTDIIFFVQIFRVLSPGLRFKKYRLSCYVIINLYSLRNIMNYFLQFPALT